MFGYYLDLAVRSLKRNKMLTALMIVTLALGIGASITTLAVLRLLSGDPLPQKSSRLFYPQLDPRPLDGYMAGQTKPDPMMTYQDAMYLLHARRATRQAAMAVLQSKIIPSQPNEHPYFADGMMTTADFFAMFDAPFQYGSGWSADDDDSRSAVVVISDFLNDKLFGGSNSVGKMLNIDDRQFRIIGVLKHWAPQPRFYAVALRGHDYGDGEALFMPLQTARSLDKGPGDVECFQDVTDLIHLETAPCEWLSVWVELNDSAAVTSYKSFLDGYVKEQISLGRFHRPETSLLNLMGWLSDQEVVPSDAQLQTYLAFGFLLICIVNTVALLLAKCLRRGREIGVRRALGATRGAIFTQFMVEAGIVGLTGGVLGLALAELGLMGVRHQPAEYASLARLDLQMFLVTFAVALVASLIAGLLPAWRACVIAPAPQLKAA
ncbi:ABC transporter permease [Dyella caseinilytica]|uniref:ABC transporter permease n=1 Tax=Dyella caseinilytica TaxID=1849581 RepID=A0ABX7GQV3_9GAMM|nr:ABC transporter permease [Dyella caseinilytica]QRN52772.1 ABC transporter permease [Dyella caseinilytica]GGA08620.1 ABC transporter ATP-binding protein [Dyella caseinilytica]